MSDTTALWGLFGSAFISSTVAPGGSEAVLAWLAHEGSYPPPWLLLVATTGNTLGAITTIWLGHWAGTRYTASHLLEPRRQQAVNWVRRWGVASLLLSWLPVVGDGLCFAAGWLRLPLAASVAAICLGKLLRYAAIIHAAS